MATVRLDEPRVHTLKPRKSTYDVHDRDLKVFGVRVLPTGAKRYFIHSQRHGRRVWKIVGEAGSIGAGEARARAKNLLAAIREGRDGAAAASPDTAFKTVGEECGITEGRIERHRTHIAGGSERGGTGAGATRESSRNGP